MKLSGTKDGYIQKEQVIYFSLVVCSYQRNIRFATQLISQKML